MSAAETLTIGLLDLRRFDPGQLDACRGYLDAGDHARLQRFRDETAARQFLAGRVLLRRMLSVCTDIAAAEWHFDIALLGRPYVAAPVQGLSWQFSISHSAQTVACCLRQHAALGIDIEAPPECLDLERFTASVFHPIEAARLQCPQGPARLAAFLQLWTLKEAYLKATGEGLRVKLKSFHFDVLGAAFMLHRDGETSSTWRFVSQPIAPAHVLAVAVPAAPAVLELNALWVSPDWLLAET